MAALSRGLRALALAAVVAVVGGCTTGPNAAGSAASHLAPLVAAVTQRTPAELPEARLATGLLPPTNRWFSGLVYGQPSMPVFPLPLAFRLTPTGFAFGVPTVASGPTVITGGFVPRVTVDVGADDQVVAGYDAASVTIGQRSGGARIGSTVIAEGSPFVTFTAASNVRVSLGDRFTRSTVGASTVKIAGTTYGLVSPGRLDRGGTGLALRAGQTATWFALADGGSLADFVAAARHPVTGTNLEHSLAGGRASTRIEYRTDGGAPTLVATMPHQRAGLAAGTDCAAGSYPSIYGELRLCSVSTLHWSVPRLRPASSLDLSRLSAAQRSRLAEQVAADLAVTRPEPSDTYYGGKWLARLANLLDIARQVGAHDTARAVSARLTTALDRWMQPTGCATRDTRCFVYDPAAKGMVGLAPSFGSEQFNDHHFHYGYFFYAAAVLASTDAGLAGRWAPVLNLLAADLATDAPSPLFPQQRVFDAFAGHSWASGTAQFGDGNNQESSSEAVAAWNGLALWATASGQPGLAAQATWLLSAEAASARAYWTDFAQGDPVYRGFPHAVVSLNWGGKRDYATFFSAEPSAMLGILVLPMSPVSGYLASDPGRIRANLAEAAPAGFDVLFGDYLLMYGALQGPAEAAAALEQTAELNEDRIDDGNSRSYLLAWIMARLEP
jgi:hypothetical protein